MTKENECYAYFTIAGPFDPAEITMRVGVAPTNSWREGDCNPVTQMERNHSRWSLRSRLSTTADIEAHIGDVLEQLDEHAPTFKELSVAEGGTLQVVGYFYAYYPGFSLERELLKKISEYSLSMDCDFYYLYSDKRDDSD